MDVVINIFAVDFGEVEVYKFLAGIV